MNNKIVIIPTFCESHLIKCQIPNIIDTIDPDYIVYNDGMFPNGTEGNKQLTKEWLDRDAAQRSYWRCCDCHCGETRQIFGPVEATVDSERRVQDQITMLITNLYMQSVNVGVYAWFFIF